MAILLLGMYPEEILIWRDTCSSTFVAGLFTIAKTWKQPKCLLTDEWIKRCGIALLILFLTPLSCCISLCILYVEPRVGKAWAKRLEGASRSGRNCRGIYSLLAGTAAITQPPSWLAQQSWQHACYIISSRGWCNRHRHEAAVMLLLSRWSSYIPTAQSSLLPSEYLLMRTHSATNDLSCYVVIICEMWGERDWTNHLG